MSKSLFPYAGSQAKNVAVFTVAGAAAPDGNISAMLEGIVETVTPGGADSADTTGGTLAGDLGTTLGAGYTAVNASGVVTVTRLDGVRLTGVGAWSTDSSQTIGVDSQEHGEALSTGLLTMGTPAVLGAGSGHSTLSRYNERDGATLCVRATLTNWSGGAKSAVFLLKVRRAQGGWYTEPTFGTKTITESTGDGIAEVLSPVIQLFGVVEVQVQLVDDGAGGNLANCSLSTWAHYA